jgi:hypothetical protein
MRKYAYTSPDSRELVDELEFVWDQVKSNVSSSNSSSPVHNHSGLGIADAPAESQSPPQPPAPAPAFSFLNRGVKRVNAAGPPPAIRTSQDLRAMTSSPLSQSQIDDESEDDAQGEEFVDAPDSQIADLIPSNPHPTFSDDNKSTGWSQLPHPSDTAEDSKAAKKSQAQLLPPSSSSKRPSAASDARWRKRMEAALVKMTAEVAALRELLEARSWAHSRRARLEQLAWAALGFVGRLIIVDLALLVLLLLWLRRKKDGRLEGAIRVLLGDAVAQVQRVGSGVQRQAQKSVGLVVGKMALGATSRKGIGGGASNGAV